MKLTYVLLILLLASCTGNIDRLESDSNPSAFFPKPNIIQLNTGLGYDINPITGDRIKPIMLQNGDTLITGVPIKIKGLTIDTNKVDVPQTFIAPSESELITIVAHPRVHKIPDNLTVIPIDHDSLKIIVLEYIAKNDTTHFHINSSGEKIKTIGDAYMAVCGLPESKKDHAQRVIRASLDIRDYIDQSNSKFQIRIGINTWPVVAGIVGVKKYAYDIWGDTVNTASRFESNGEPGKINISKSTFTLIKEDFECEYRGKIEAKGKGEIEMCFVTKTL